MSTTTTLITVAAGTALALGLLASLAWSPAQASRDDTSAPPAKEPMSTSPTPPSAATTGSTPKYSQSGHDLTPWTRDRVLEAAKSLTPDQRNVVLEAGTEPAFCGVFTDNKEEGIYVCVIGGLPLFKSDHKFISKSGWASFFAPYDPAHIIEKVDRSHGMVRTEILDARTGAHLGHVFDDGPPPTGKRYCLNSAALRFIKKGDPIPAESQPAVEIAYFGGGCFWGVEDAFAGVKGVLDAESGFSNGKSARVTYKEVCSGKTGAAEVVRVTFDPKVVSYRDLVKQFFRMHDPTTLNRQGPDVGDQYRSGIYTTSDEQARIAREIIEKLGALDAFKTRPIVTEVKPVTNYVKAEDYHQDYHLKNGGHCHMRGYQGDMPF